MSEARAFSSICRLLASAERATSLLERCQPENAAAEIARVTERFLRGGGALPRFRYAAAPPLANVRRALDHAARTLAKGGLVSRLFSARATELSLEAALVEAVGTEDFARLARQRFPLPKAACRERAADDVAEWIALEAPPGGEPGILAEDTTDARSLVSQLSALVGEFRLPCRIVMSASLTSSAATGLGCVVVRSGLRHSEKAARRIALHEVHAHALPRARAEREPLGLYAVGTAGSGSDEEGRALLIEERHGLLDVSRRRDLAHRHIAALSVRRGADFVETVRGLAGSGAGIRDAVQVAARAHRGGGLAREIVYLPARHRVRAAFAEDPALESFLARGRVSLEAARVLRDASDAAIASDAALFSRAQSNVATTGA